MRERGIIFNAEMVRAVLEGRKTQTRRIMKVQPESNQLGLLRITASTNRSDIGKYHWAESNATGNHVRWKLFACPYGAVGDRLWVRETWQGPLIPEVEFMNPNDFYSSAYCKYAADGGPEPEYVDMDDDIRRGWKPSIHMPRWASRITLEITGVRVERLYGISNADAMSEGVGVAYGWDETKDVVPRDARRRFAELWQSIYGDESWQANPWVWVIEFKRVEVSHV